MARVIVPHNYTPRSYQIPILRAREAGMLRFVQVWHRRGGKEKTDLNLMVKEAFRRVGLYFYMFPKLTQGRKILWDGADKSGFKFLNHIPAELRDGPPNQTEMKIKLINGSIIQIVGSDHYDTLVGSNPIGIVFSEYSLQDPLAWSFFRPILAENGGWAIFNFTPRGENHAFDLYELAMADPENWFCQLLTVDDTGAISKDVLAQERREIIRLNGNDAIYWQEYFCSFSVPISGAYYADNITAAYNDGRVGTIPHDEGITVDTWWDLGINDRMSIWFSQRVGQEYRMIDYLENSDKGMPWYIKKLKEKPYVYGRHTAPHDINVRELMSGKKRIDTASKLGIDFEVAPKIAIADGIDLVRSIFNQVSFEKTKCKSGLAALKNYRKQYDEVRKTYLNKPYHDWSSNGADAFRTFGVAHDIGTSGKSTGRGDKYARGRDRKPAGASAISALG